MPYMTEMPQRVGLTRQLLLAGAALLALSGNALAQAPANAIKSPRTLIVADSVLQKGTTISGSWREHAADGSWHRVAFTLDGNVATVTFADGKPGRRLPGVTRYAYAGPGRKDGKVIYDEARSFTDATPDVLARADQSSPIPDAIATRIRDLGGDIRLLQRLADISQRTKDIGSAFDAARRPAGDGGWGLPGELPGSGTRGKTGKWADPRGGVGRDGRAGDETEQITIQSGGDGTSTTVVTRHDDGSSTTFDVWTKTDSEGTTTGTSTTERDRNGEITGGSSTTHDTSTGRTRDHTYSNDASTGLTHWKTAVREADGITIKRHGIDPTAPTETPYSRGSGHEEEVARYLPWLAEINYINWKRENDLVRSGGRIAQPGEQPAQAPGDTPAVGANAVVNCVDSSTNPCAGESGAAQGTDVRGGFGSISQPGLGDPGLPMGPLGGMGGPPPVPNPQQGKP